jgi:hypothetical protein
MFVFACLILAINGPEPIRSQDKTPNLAGRWVLNVGRSDSQKLNPPRWKCCVPKSEIIVIDQNGPNITIITEGIQIDYLGKESNRFKNVEKVYTDGSESVNVLYTEFSVLPDGRQYYKSESGEALLPAKMEYYYTAKWEGQKLLIQSVAESGNKRVWAWSESTDGATLTAEVYPNATDIHGKKPDSTLVFDRSKR